jgi:chromosome partitioning protein
MYTCRQTELIVHVVCLLSLKGGSGKSTVVQSLSVCAQQHGHRTLIVELDPQGTLKNWSKRRESEQPRVVQTLPQSVGDVLEEAKAEGVHWEIQSVKDFDAVLPSLAEARRADKPAYVLMNQVPPNSPRLIRRRQLQIQKHYDIAVLSRFLCRRADFEYCDERGLSAAELNPSGPAAEEIDRLYALLQSIFIMRSLKVDKQALVPAPGTSVGPVSRSSEVEPRPLERGQARTEELTQ